MLGGELEVRRLGFGAMRIVDDREEGVRVLRRAVELGVNFIDTANIYGAGRSEEIIAQALTRIVSVQNQYNRGLLTSDDVVDACAEEGLAFMPWAPLGEGLTRGSAYEIQWLLDRSPTILVIPGTSSVAHLEDNMLAVA